MGWTVDENSSFEILDHLYNGGIKFIDTADIYSNWAPGNKGGESEKIIGNWMAARKNRSDMMIATKVGGQVTRTEKGLSRDYIYTAVERSLKRLKTDYIDVYQSHYDDNETPIHETLEAYERLIRDGKVRVIGASNFEVDRLKATLSISKRHDLPFYHLVQLKYNLFDRKDFENNMAPFCLKHSISSMCYRGLADGFLSGKYKSQADIINTPRAEALKHYCTKRGFKIVKVLLSLSKGRNVSAAQVALAWLISKTAVTCVVASATSVEQAEDLIAAGALQLSKEELLELDNISK